jgi:hypothetical protein
MMVDRSVFYATINEVPPELEEQANDLDKLLDECRKYMKEWGVSAGTLLNDLDLVLEG